MATKKSWSTQRFLAIFLISIGLGLPIYSGIRTLTDSEAQKKWEANEVKINRERLLRILYRYDEVYKIGDVNLMSRFADKNWGLVTNGFCHGPICDSIQDAFRILRQPYQGTPINEEDIARANKLLVKAYKALQIEFASQVTDKPPLPK